MKTYEVNTTDEIKKAFSRIIINFGLNQAKKIRVNINFNHRRYGDMSFLNNSFIINKEDPNETLSNHK